MLRIRPLSQVPMNAFRLAVFAVIISVLCACGFQLREEARLPAGMQSVLIQGAEPVSPLGRDLRKALVRSGAQIVDTAAPGTAVMRIIANHITTDVLSVGANARANEYTMRYHVEFDVIDAAGGALLPRQVIELTREFTFDVSQAIGVAAEQDLLTEELQRDMVQTILRRLEVIGNAQASS